VSDAERENYWLTQLRTFGGTRACLFSVRITAPAFRAF
jgi:hypothetical protein